MKILACQIAIPEIVDAGQRSAFLNELTARISDELASQSVDLVVLPELTTIDYSRAAFDNLEVLAEDLDGASFQAFAHLAQSSRTSICYGIPRRANGRVHIAQVVVGPDGAQIGHFDKLHLAHYGASPEKDYFAPGRGLFIFEVGEVRVAPIICYDIRFPELARLLCLDHRVDLILHCGAYFTDPSYYSWHAFVVTRALENQVYVLSLNRAGATYGGSVFCPPWVDETAPETVFSRDETFAVVEVDKSRIDEARRSYSFLADRYPDYGDFDLQLDRIASPGNR